MESIVGGFIHVVFFPGKELPTIDIVISILFHFFPVEVKALIGGEETSFLFTHLNKFISKTVTIYHD